MHKISDCYIAFGANLSNPAQTFRKAISLIAARGLTLTQMSSLWQSPAWPAGSGQPDYINAVGRGQFSGTARELLAALHNVEAALGRERSVRNAARTLDLDLISHGPRVIEANDITVPHPRMMDRGFVLLPLSEVSGNWVHPELNETVWDAIAKLPLKDVEGLRRLRAFDLE